VLVLAGCGGHHGVAPPELGASGNWAAPNATLGGTREAPGSSIDAGNVSSLRQRWAFAFRGPVSPGAGYFASTPLVVGDRVYIQELNSDVYALDRTTGKPVWGHMFRSIDGGPNGLAAGYGRIYGNTCTSAFALDAKTGALLWLTRITVSVNCGVGF
jgi:alcohol dehydrogenase (cytochrome c)